MAGLLAYSIWLPLVLGHASVNFLDDIRTNRSLENAWKGSSVAVSAIGPPAGSAISSVDSNGRSGRLFNRSVSNQFPVVFLKSRKFCQILPRAQTLSEIVIRKLVYNKLNRKSIFQRTILS